MGNYFYFKRDTILDIQNNTSKYNLRFSVCQAVRAWWPNGYHVRLQVRKLPHQIPVRTVGNLFISYRYVYICIVSDTEYLSFQIQFPSSHWHHFAAAQYGPLLGQFWQTVLGQCHANVLAGMGSLLVTVTGPFAVQHCSTAFSWTKRFKSCLQVKQLA